MAATATDRSDAGALAGVRAVLFDTFGTVVDWRGSIARDLGAWGVAQGLQADWTALADRWRGDYAPQMDRVRRGALPWTGLDALHQDALERLLPDFGLQTLDAAQRRHVLHVWHRLDPWPDAVEGLTRIRRHRIVGPLSNGNISLLIDLARHAGLPWDGIFSAEHFGHYKPDPKVYLGACRQLDLPPEQVMLCAAHNGDLAAAQALGLRTAFVARPTEYGPAQTKDLRPDGRWDLVAADLIELARQLG